MKKIIIPICLIFLPLFTFSQNVEKLDREILNKIEHHIDKFVDTMQAMKAINSRDKLFLVKLNQPNDSSGFSLSITEVYFKSKIKCCLPSFNSYYVRKGRTYLLLNIKMTKKINNQLHCIRSDKDREYIYSMVFDDTETNKVNPEAAPSVHGFFTYTFTDKTGLKIFFGEHYEVPGELGVYKY